MSDYLYPSGAQVVLAPGLGPDDEAWHAARLLGLGGSDMAAICGLDQHTSPLEVWHTKVGRPVPRRPDAVRDEAALMGHLLEPTVADRFQAITGLPVFPPPGTLRALDPAWAQVNLDGVTLERGEFGVLEFKTRSSYALQEWLDEPPAGPYIQVQHGLMVTGWTYGYVACLVGGQRTLVHRVERDDALIRDMRAVGDQFWQAVSSDVRPPVDGSEATRDLLNRLHPDADGSVVVADPDEVEQLLRARRAGRDALAAASATVTAAENRLKAIAGDATEVWTRGELAYSWSPRRGQISWKSAALDIDPDIDPEPYRGAPTRVLTVPTEES